MACARGAPAGGCGKLPGSALAASRRRERRTSRPPPHAAKPPENPDEGRCLMSSATTKALARQALWMAAVAMAGTAVLLEPRDAQAFCGFYVSGGDAKLFNNATQVVLMREGIKTILSMQNNYQGPPGDFAMVVPVPVVLKEQNVKTLPAELFAKVDTLSAPRLVEYWEQDPCASPVDDDRSPSSPSAGGGPPKTSDPGQSPGTVKVEAQFAVGEYQIVILSATEATALETWLVQNGYKIPSGAASLFKSYIQQGQYFFVAKVDPQKVTFKDGHAVLSPLRFDYDSESFALPVRLGLVNSAGEQDLIVYVLSREGRYEVANFPNVTVPTNIAVSQDVRKDYPTFYTKLFAKTLEVNPGAVVTEYSWDASSCDPCPGPSMNPEDYATLGADTLGNAQNPYQNYYGWTLTRLHARYGKDSLTDDLVFRKASPIVGGRERYSDKGVLETGALPESGGINNFQGRYIMRNPWTGPIKCMNPRRGIWGGPPSGMPPAQTGSALSPNTRGGSAPSIAASPIGDRELPTLVKQDVPELGVKPQLATKSSGCSVGDPEARLGAGLGLVAMAGFIAFVRRRRR
jgi:hypothetical protein